MGSARLGRHSGLALALVALVNSACYGFLPVPTHRDRIHEATTQERERCDAQPVDARVYGPEIVERVGPLYFYVQSVGNREARLLGAELRLRPLPGMTPELLAHVLMCHSAQLVLGHAQGQLSSEDPYWLPHGWVKIGVRSDEGSFVVALEGEDLVQAKEILARAHAFAGRSQR